MKYCINSTGTRPSYTNLQLSIITRNVPFDTYTSGLKHVILPPTPLCFSTAVAPGTYATAVY